MRPLGSRIPPNASGMRADNQLGEVAMPHQPERRNGERVPCRLVCPYELTKSVESNRVKVSEGHGHSINCSRSGMLLLLPEEVDQRQVIEIHVPSTTKTMQRTTLAEVCWTRLITVSAGVQMYLTGTRVVFELPFHRESSQAH